MIGKLFLEELRRYISILGIKYIRYIVLGVWGEG